MYSSSFADGSHTYGPCPGQRTPRDSFRSRRSDPRYADSDPSPGAMNTLPVPSTVSPVKQTLERHTRHTLSAECPGVAIASNGPALSPSPGLCEPGAPSKSAASAWSACPWVSTTPSIPSAAAARTACTCSSSAGPGSTTKVPTT